MNFNFFWTFNLLLILMGFQAHSQTMSCGDFSITNVSSDSTNPNGIQVSVFYAAPASSFTNYPYISALIDCHGDTVATGNMFVFGQFGQSTVDFPLVLNQPNPCEPFTAVFLYSDNFGVTDTCSLSYFGTSSLENNEEIDFRIFPNPTKDLLHVQVSEEEIGAQLELSDLTGKIIEKVYISSSDFYLNIQGIPNGNYFLRIDKIKSRQGKSFRLLTIY